MALPVVPNTMSIKLNWNLSTDASSLTNFYFTYSGGPPAIADLVSIANTAGVAATSHLLSLLPTSYTLNTVEMRDLASTTGAATTVLAANNGTRSGTPTPLNVCALVNHSIARHYRGGKPRSYLPFGVEGDLANNYQFGSTFVGLVNTGFAAWVTEVLGASSGTTAMVAHVNVSYYQGVNPPTTLPSGRVKQSSKVRTSVPTPDVISSSVMSARIGSQRRRVRAA